jgi:hypothetical protein
MTSEFYYRLEVGALIFTKKGQEIKCSCSISLQHRCVEVGFDVNVALKEISVSVVLLFLRT